jgi:hypothetical protein
MYGFVRKIGMHRVDNSIKYYHQQMIDNRMSTLGWKVFFPIALISQSVAGK